MPKLDELLYEHLTVMAGMLHRARAHIPPLVERVYSSYEGLMLAKGQPFAATYQLNPLELGPEGDCYRNTIERVVRHPDLRYCEGYGLPTIDGWTGIPVHHAWAVDTDGHVVETTWPEALASAYFGMIFTWDEVRRHMLAANSIGILESDYRLGFPLLRFGELFPPGYGDRLTLTSEI